MMLQTMDSGGTTLSIVNPFGRSSSCAQNIIGKSLCNRLVRARRRIIKNDVHAGKRNWRSPRCLRHDGRNFLPAHHTHRTRSRVTYIYIYTTMWQRKHV